MTTKSASSLRELPVMNPPEPAARPASNRSPARRIAVAVMLSGLVFAALWIMMFNTSLLIGSGCCVVIVAASSLSDLLPRSLPRSLLLESLTPAPRRQNHTTSPSASGVYVSCAICVHRISPRVRDVANAPLVDEMRGVMELIWLAREAEYFS